MSILTAAEEVEIEQALAATFNDLVRRNPLVDPVKLRNGEKAILVAVKFILAMEAFFATILLGLVRIPVDAGMTIGTNGKHLVWDVQFVLDAGRCKNIFVLIHEVMHVILKHHLRRGDRDKGLWNDACDLAINPLIVHMGLDPAYSSLSVADLRTYERHYFPSMAKSPEYVMPDDGLFRPEFIGMSADEIYPIIAKEREEEEGEGGGGEGEGEGEGEGDGSSTSGSGGHGKPKCDWGHVEDMVSEDGEALTAEEIKEVEKDLDRQILTAENIAKGRGQMPAAVSEAVDNLMNPSQDYRELLKDALQDTTPRDFSFARPNRFYLQSNLVMPTTEKENLGHVGVFADASGSINRNEWTQFMSDVFSIFNEMEPEILAMIQFDSVAGEPQQFDLGDEIDLTRHHSGGTTFKVAFDKAEEHGLDNEFDVVLLFTDGGDYTYPDHEPPYPVIWLTTGAFIGGDPPFGRVVQVKYAS